VHRKRQERNITWADRIARHADAWASQLDSLVEDFLVWKHRTNFTSSTSDNTPSDNEEDTLSSGSYSVETVDLFGESIPISITSL